MFLTILSLSLTTLPLASSTLTAYTAFWVPGAGIKSVAVNVFVTNVFLPDVAAGVPLSSNTTTV